MGGAPCFMGGLWKNIGSFLANVGIERFAGKSNFKLLSGGKLFSGSEVGESLVVSVGAAVSGGVVDLGLLPLDDDAKAGVMKNDVKFVELLLADMIGVFAADSPKMGELGNVKVCGLGLLGRSFLSRCWT